ncbi:hypothetical protein FJ930_29395 [Mesorhizobium sp. B2-4-15]|uniref:hypothetical protein n=1 Tax=Mesorhizobium sp. B2-4-15 TaxID=2589934 RepID=UPI00114E2B7A|nr:hypothetical protein [Mesorhizobium sp. B2-4-15]TPK59093.1 hypothetical protein FJ930_29395 [Mesorhizobium sp. B2-4-15]
MDSTQNSRVNGFVFLYREAKRRFLKPIGQVNFWTYLVLAIFLLGGLPIYIEWFRMNNGATHDADGIKLALFTVFPAIMGASAVQLVLDKDNSPIRMAGLSSLVVCFVVTLALITNIFSIPDKWSIITGVVFCLLAVFTWWVANGLDPIFEDTIRPDDSVGGDVKAKLDGDLSGIKA